MNWGIQHFSPLIPQFNPTEPTNQNLTPKLKKGNRADERSLILCTFHLPFSDFSSVLPIPRAAAVLLPLLPASFSSEDMQFFGGSEINPSPPAVTASGNNAHMIYIFNRNGICLLYREWNRPLRTLSSQQDHKLMFGLLFSLKSLTAKMDPVSAEKVNLGVPQLPGEGCSFHSFRTNTYKLTFMETPSGIKLILVTHPRTGDLRESLKYIYNLYVEYVVKNPLYTPGSPIRSELFSATLDQYVRGLG